MNTRLQVEHPITEYITGLDIVEWMIRIAAGERLPFKQSDVKLNGWAMEARVYAEDPLRNFLPSIGKLVRYKEPGQGDSNIRVDSGVLEGSEISTFYDPLISKLVTYGRNRAEAIEKMKYALDTYVIRGLNHNVNFLRDVLENKRYCSGNISTKFIPEEYPQGFKGHVLTPEETNQLLLLTASLHHLRYCRDSSIATDVYSTETKEYRIFLNGKEESVKVSAVGPWPEKILSCNFQGKTTEVDLSEYDVDGHVINSSISKKPLIAQLIKITDLGYDIQLCGTIYSLKVLSPREAPLYQFMREPVKLNTDNYILSPMAGNLVSVSVKPGDRVVIGQEIAIVEAMKMQNILKSTRDAIVKAVPGVPDKSISLDEVIVEFQPEAKDPQEEAKVSKSIK
jgi:propionyl-CoA carboxylase alpha chain